MLRLESSATVGINSTPTGAEIYIDEDFAGNTPSTINVPLGKHAVSVRKSGFQDWVRTVNVSGGSITLAAGLVPGANQPSTASAPVPISNKDSYKVAEVSSATAETMRSSGQSQNSTSVVVETPPGWIGVSTKPADGGVLIITVAPNGPAAQAGLQTGDIIQGLNGTVVKSPGFDESIAKLKPGTKIIISYVRSAWARETIVTVTRQP